MAGINKMPKLRILVIDDEEAVRETLCENLVECGYEVASAMNAQDAENQMRDILPDLVITDIIMPQRDGSEIILDIRSRYPNIKIIAISGGGRTKTTDFLALAEKRGADAVLEKPIDIDELEKIIRRIAQ
jgi:CheY-like chemotaxis protein